MTDPKKLIIKAAKHGDVAALKTLLAADPKLINARDTDGSTPLHCVTWKGHLAAAEFLVQSGADVNATTPLHAAAHANQPRIAQVLIDNGANVKAKDMEGRTPLFHTTFHKAKAVAKILEPLE